MDSFQREKADLRKREQGEQKHLENKKILCPTYDGLNSDHFLKEPSLLHTQYSVDHSGRYVSFCIEVKPDGIYWVPSGRKPKRIGPQTITDQQIHNWFDFLVGQ